MLCIAVFKNQDHSNRGENFFEYLQVPLFKTVVIRKIVAPTFLYSVCT